MTKPIHPPASWRDLSHAELIALLEECPLLFRPSDLVWAQWRVASAAFLAAFDAEHAAWKIWHGKKNGKTLTAWEEAQSKNKRAAATMRRLERRKEALYALHQQINEAERG